MIKFIHFFLISIITLNIQFIFSNSSELETFGSKTELKFLSEKSISQRNLGYPTSQTELEFDSYVLSMQLPITQCFKYPHCHEKILEIPKNTFSIHGLWPNKNGRPIEDCNTGDQIDIVFSDHKLESLVKRYWKSLKDDDKSFWDHEYNKHGYCWSMRYRKTPEEFFRNVIDLYLKLDLEDIIFKAKFNLQEPVQEFSYHTLMEKFTPIINMNFDLKCLHHEDKQYLSDVFINLDLNYRSLPGIIGSNCNKSQPISIIFQ